MTSPVTIYWTLDAQYNNLTEYFGGYTSVWKEGVVAEVRLRAQQIFKTCSVPLPEQIYIQARRGSRDSLLLWKGAVKFTPVVTVHGSYTSYLVTLEPSEGFHAEEVRFV